MNEGDGRGKPDKKRALYEQIIIDHNKNPRNFCNMENPSCKACGYNALCGDQFTIFLKIDDGRITDCSFQGCGCAISKSSASLMTVALRGKTPEEAKALFARFQQMVTSDPADPVPDDVGKLACLCGVREYPVRVKCATLAWHAMVSALDQKEDPAATAD